MKKLIAAILASALFASFSFAQGTPKVLTVDLQKVLNEYWEFQDARERVQGSIQTAEEERQRLEEEIRERREQIQQEAARSTNPALTEDAKKEAQMKAAELTTKAEEDFKKYQMFVQTTQANLNKQQQDVFTPIQEKVVESVKEIAKDKGANMVLNTNGGVVLFADDMFDITDDVIAVLNADAPDS